MLSKEVSLEWDSKAKNDDLTRREWRNGDHGQGHEHASHFKVGDRGPQCGQKGNLTGWGHRGRHGSGGAGQNPNISTIATLCVKMCQPSLIGTGLRKPVVLLATAHCQVMWSSVACGLISFIRIWGTQLFASSVKEKIVFL